MRRIAHPMLRSAVGIAALGALSLGGTAAAADLVRGPMLQQPAPDGISVVMDFDEPVVPTIRYGLDPDSLDGAWTAPEAAERFEVRIDGLESGATYHYEVVVDDEALGEVSTFPTTVAPGTPFDFLVFGDTRSRPDAHRAVIEGMVGFESARFYVQTGDLVSDGEIREQWDEYFEIEQPMLEQVPIYPAIGNHDEHDGDASVYVDLFDNPRNSPQPEYFYSFDYGNVHAVVLDSHVHVMTWLECLPERDLLLDDCFTVEQNDWLIADLEAAAVDPDIDHILLFIHIGPYSSKEGRSGNAQMRMLMPTFYDLGVTAIISGHDHYYERGFSQNGIPYVITGGGGAPLYDIGDPSSAPHEVVYNEAIEHWVEVSVDGPMMYISTKATDGRVIDEFSIDATPECDADSACVDAAPDVPCDSFTTFCSLGGRCVAECDIDEGDAAEPDAGSDADDDAGNDDAGNDDAGSDDAGSDDAGNDDAGNDDAGSDDAGSDDAGDDDAGSDDVAGSDSSDGQGATRRRSGCAQTGRSPGPLAGFLGLLLVGATRRRR